MARIIYSSLVSQVTGNVAGSTFQKGNGSYVVKNRTAKKRQPSTRALRQRQIIQVLTQKWRSLTNDQRDTWQHPPVAVNNHNPNAKIITLRGLPLYTYCNSRIIQDGYTLLTVPPKDYHINTFGSVQLVQEQPPRFLTISATNPDTGLNPRVTLKVSAGYSPGTVQLVPDTGPEDQGAVAGGSLLKKPRVWVRNYLISPISEYAISLADYTAIFGTPVPGTVICVESYSWSAVEGIPGPSYLRAIKIT